MEAVDLYGKFPFVETSVSFDDGFLHGEIVRHLVKAGIFDDQRLKTSLIAFVHWNIRIINALLLLSIKFLIRTMHNSFSILFF
jgi:hypothetical protein